MDDSYCWPLTLAHRFAKQSSNWIGAREMGKGLVLVPFSVNEIGLYTVTWYVDLYWTLSRWNKLDDVCFPWSGGWAGSNNCASPFTSKYPFDHRDDSSRPRTPDPAKLAVDLRAEGLSLFAVLASSAFRSTPPVTASCMLSTGKLKDWSFLLLLARLCRLYLCFCRALMAIMMTLILPFWELNIVETDHGELPWGLSSQS